MNVTSGSAQTGIVGMALASPVVVSVFDQDGNPLAGVTVSFSPLTFSGSLDVSSATTDANGRVQFGWTLGTLAGADSVVIAAGSISPAYATATATPDAPAHVSVVGGDNQTVGTDTPLAEPLVVRVTDQYGNAVEGVAITWSTDDGSLSATTSVTDAGGIAQNTLVAGDATGQFSVTAMVSADVEVVFTETAT